VKFHVRKFTEGAFTEMPGWEDWRVTICVDTVQGRPRAIGIKGIEFVGDGSSPPLTGRRLATLPLQAMADLLVKSVDWSLQPDLKRDLQRIRESDGTGYTDPRRVTTPKRVAEVYLQGVHDPAITAIRQFVAETLNISQRTAQNYITQAFELGLIPAEYRRRPLKTSGPVAEGAKNKKGSSS
jgi:hypothetical protein